MWKPADVMATMMIATICAIILGVFIKSWISDVPIPIERIQIIESLFIGMFGLVAYRMGKGDI